MFQFGQTWIFIDPYTADVNRDNTQIQKTTAPIVTITLNEDARTRRLCIDKWRKGIRCKSKRNPYPSLALPRHRSSSLHLASILVLSQLLEIPSMLVLRPCSRMVCGQFRRNESLIISLYSGYCYCLLVIYFDLCEAFV